MKRNSRVTKCAAILSCLATGFFFQAFDARIASAQVLYGSIVGTVTDQSRALISKAAVTVRSTSTSLSRQASTDEAGYYAIPNLPPGAYDVSVTATGFKPLTERNVNVLINTDNRVDLGLEVGTLSESVTVEASAAVLQTTKADINANLGQRPIANLPLYR